MAGTARAFQREGSRDRPEFEEAEDDEIEHEGEHLPGPKRSSSNLKAYSLPLAGVVLAGLLGSTIWLLLNARHEPHSTHGIPELSRVEDGIPQAS